MSEAKLREFLQFNEADLRANQGGQVSDRQKKRLAERRKTDARRWSIVLILLLAIPVAALIWLIQATLSAGLPLSGIFNIVPAPAMAVVAFAVLFVGWVFISIVYKKPDDTLKSMQGEVEYVRVERQEKDYARSDSQHDIYKTVQAYELRVGGAALGDVNKAMMELVRQGDEYRIYYTRDGGILSAEAVKKGK